MSYDTIATLKGAKIQFGPKNDRIYLMKLGDSDVTELLPALDELAKEHQFGKIFAKIPASNEPAFLNAGYQSEARVPNFYQGKVDGVFLGKYFKPKRAIVENNEALESILTLAQGREKSIGTIELSEGFEFHFAQAEDAETISEIYKEVFASYPFPIHDPAYLRKTMQEDVVYFSIWHEGQMIAVSSAEMDLENGNVEMTDFATLESWRGHRFGVFLLDRMEQEMKNRGIKTAYTIARAISPGMNITFAKLGYHYGGRLINNTQISGGLESMNIWCKPLL